MKVLLAFPAMAHDTSFRHLLIKADRTWGLEHPYSLYERRLARGSVAKAWKAFLFARSIAEEAYSVAKTKTEGKL